MIQNKQLLFKIGSTLVSLFLALVNSLLLDKFFPINDFAYTYSNSIFSLFIFAACYMLYKMVLRKISKRLAVISLILGFVFSVLIYAGNNLIKYDSVNLYDWKALAFTVAEAPLFAAIAALVIIKIPSINETVRIKLTPKKEFSKRKRFLFSWLLIFLAWIPGWVASYPGIFGYDSVYQLSWYINDNIFLHHPWIHTYMIGFFVYDLGGLFGSLEAGMAVYCVFQMLCMSAAFAWIYVYLREHDLSNIISIGFLLLFMFLPVNVLMAVSSTKDVLYAALFALMVMSFCKIAQNEQVLYNISFDISFVLLVFGQMIFRNQGKYVFGFAMVWAFFLFRKYWKRLLLLFVSVALLFSIYSGPVTKLSGAHKAGSIKEMLSIPCVQLARASIFGFLWD